MENLNRNTIIDQDGDEIFWLWRNLQINSDKFGK